MISALFAIAAGASLAFAFAPYGLFPLAILAPAALFALLLEISPRRAAWLGWCFGLGMFGHGVWWVQVSIHKFGLPLYSFSVTMTVLFVMFLALLFSASVAYGIARIGRDADLHWRLLGVMPALWMIGEWSRGWLLTGFPWLLLGYSQTDSWLGAYAPLGGAHAVSYAAALIAGCLVVVVKTRRYPALLLALVVLAGAFGLRNVAWTSPDGESRTVALVQAAIPQEIKWRGEYRERTLEFYTELTAPHWDKDILLWPETAVPAFPDEIPETLQTLTELANKQDAVLLVGIPTGDRRQGPYFNSLMLLDGTDQRYDKHHLVPFGEYLPLDDLIRPILNFLSIPMSNFARGKPTQPPLTHGDLRIGVSICYEDAYHQEVRRPLPSANILVNVSDDAWFGDSIAPHQHLQISRMRAREAGRYLLRATNTGISAIIDEFGQVQARSPQFEPYTLTGTAQPLSGATPFVRVGDWPLLGWCVFVLGFAWRRKH